MSVIMTFFRFQLLLIASLVLVLASASLAKKEVDNAELERSVDEFSLPFMVDNLNLLDAKWRQKYNANGKSDFTYNQLIDIEQDLLRQGAKIPACESRTNVEKVCICHKNMFPLCVAKTAFEHHVHHGTADELTASCTIGNIERCSPSLKPCGNCCLYANEECSINGDCCSGVCSSGACVGNGNGNGNGQHSVETDSDSDTDETDEETDTNPMPLYDDDDDLSGGAIAGIVIGSVVGAILLIALLALLLGGGGSMRYTGAGPTVHRDNPDA